MRAAFLLALAPALLAALAWGGGDPPAPAGAVVLVLADRFQDEATGGPVTRVSAGEPVTFRVVAGMHTATRGAAAVAVEGAGPASPILAPGQSYAWTPRQAGPVPYTCLLHAHMNGLITVEAQR